MSLAHASGEQRTADPRGDRARQIMWGLATGVVTGLAMRGLGGWQPGWWPWLEGISRHVLEPVGQVFLRLLLLVVVPLVGVSVVSGVLELGRGRSWGRLTATTFGLFLLNMAVAVVLGLLIMNLWAPGRGLPADAVERLYAGQTGTAEWSAAPRRPELTPGMLVDLLMPRNWVGAVVDFQILPLITFGVLFGFAARSLPDRAAERVRSWMAVTGQVLFRMVEMAMRLAPVAVAALIGAAVLRVGPELLKMLAGFVIAVLGAMTVHLVGVLGLLVRLAGGRNPLAFFRAVRLALVTAFCTSSSAATLPTSLAVARDRLGVHPGTAGFVLPLGATMNMSGTALYEGCVVLLVAQVHGVSLTWADQLTLLVLAVLGAVAVASVPGASLPVIMGLLAQFRLPPEGVMLVLGVDRLLDMARTTLNVAADLVATCVADRVVKAGHDPGQQALSSSKGVPAGGPSEETDPGSRLQRD